MRRAFLSPRWSLVLLSCLLLSSLLLLLLPSPVVANDSGDGSAVYASAANSTEASSLAAATEEFIPTDEWQTVKPGQAVPPGLWIRMDMTTGEKTARLLPKEDEEGSSSNAAAGLVLVPSSDNDTAGGRLELEEDEEEDEQEGYSDAYADASEPTFIPPPSESSVGTLGNIALEEPPAEFSNPSPAYLAALKAARAARLRELSEAFGPTDDLVVIKQMLAVLMEGASMEHAEQALDTLEVLVHQIDNAQDWATLGGLDMALQILSSAKYDLQLPQSAQRQSSGAEQAQAVETADAVSDRLQMQRLARLQEKAALVLGSAAQNNAAVKREAMKEQTTHFLLTLLDHLSDSIRTLNQSGHVTATDADGETPIGDAELRQSLGRVQAKLLYALSSLLRSSKDAQDDFHQRRGADRLQALLASSSAPSSPTFSPSSSSSSTSPFPFADRQQTVVYGKTVALLSDLLHDRLINDVNASSEALFHTLTTPLWCDSYVTLAQHAGQLTDRCAAEDAAASTSTSLHALNTVHSIAILLQLLTTHDLCQPHFAQVDFVHRLQQLLAVLAERKVTGAAVATSDEEDSSREALQFHYSRLHDKTSALLAQLAQLNATHSAAASSSSFSTSGSSSPSSPPASADAPRGWSVAGTPLSPCSFAPLTGAMRDGYCAFHPSDYGRHVVCAEVTDAFLDFTQQRGNDLSTARDGFPGLVAGDRWCLCAGRWKEALEHGVAPPVLLAATEAKAADTVSTQALLAHAHHPRAG